MGNKIVLIYIQAVTCLITAIILITSCLLIYFDGVRMLADNPMASIYTAEKIAGKFLPVAIAFALTVIVNIICVIAGARDMNQDKAATNIDINKNTEGRLSAGNLKILRTVVLVFAILFIVIGIFNGSMNDVLIKASKICTECIGLG